MKLFGTDGIRGRANHPPLDTVTLVKLGAVVGCQLASGTSRPSVLIADDGRHSAEMIRSALATGILSEGLDVVGAGLLTTPALAWETRLGGHRAGVSQPPTSQLRNHSPQTIPPLIRQTTRRPQHILIQIDRRSHKAKIASPHHDVTMR